MNRTRRARAVIGAVGPAVVIWVVVVPLLGHRLIVTGGPPGREALEIGLAPVVVIALAGWGLLALLERLLPRFARRMWTITAVAVLLLSFVPLLAPGMSVATRITLGVPHFAIAGGLIPSMARVPARPALTPAGGTA